MTQQFQRWFVVVLLVLSLGTPWIFLQSAAWVNMLVKFSRTTSFAQAVTLTFDGKHPCRLCRLVKEGQAREREQKSQAIQPLQKMELGLPPALMVIFHPSAPRNEIEPDRQFETRNERPPTPPPRA